MRPPLIFTLNQSIPFHLKRSFWRNDFSPLISSKPSSPQETEHREKERERKSKKRYWKKEREKLQESLQIKGEVNILRGGKHFNFENPFYMIPFSPPPSYHFENLFQTIEKVFITLFGHPLAWQYSWLELYPFSLPMSSTYSAYKG
jgi:hypothetical protein